MALRFQPYPIQPEEEKTNIVRDFANPLLQVAGMVQQGRNAASDQKFRQFQMEMMKAKEAREAAAHSYEYGDPSAPAMTTAGGFEQADPRLSLYQPATMPGESQYGNMMGASAPDPVGPRAAAVPGAAEVGAGDMGGGGMVERFRAWQQGRKAPAAGGDMTDEQLFAPGMGSKRREDYLKTRKSRLDETKAEREGRETEADISLKGAQADFYKRRKSGGGSGRYMGWTPQSLETRKRNLLAQLRTARLDDREDIMADIQEIDDIQSKTLETYGGGSAAGGEPGAAPREPRRPKPVLNPPAPGGAPRFKVGQVATNPKTGAKLQFNGQGWVPMR